MSSWISSVVHFANLYLMVCTLRQVSAGCSHEFEVLNCTDGVTFKCTTDGGGATIFQGDGFSCKNELILLHSRFSSRNGTNLSCNNGSIVGMSLGVEGNCYISQLHIMTTFDLTGKAIECIHESYNTVAVHKLVGIYKGNEICGSQSDVAEIGIFENKLLIARAGAITGTILGLIVLLTSTVVGIIIIKRKGLQKALSIFIKHRHQQGFNAVNSHSLCLSVKDKSANVSSQTTLMYKADIEVHSEAETLDFDTVLNELRNKLDYHLWYQFGIELGVQKLFLDSIKSCPNYECMIELVDYWLRNHPGQPTWNEIKAALDKMTEYKNKNPSVMLQEVKS